MLLVIFGAGASFDSSPTIRPHPDMLIDQPEQPYRPPLASQLFSRRFGETAQRFYQCLPIIPQLRHVPNQSTVEQELQKLQEEASYYKRGHTQLAAVRYYLQEVLWTCSEQWLKTTQGVTNYATLIDKILRRKSRGFKVCFVTFNYDFLLEKALQHAGYAFNNLPAYIESDLMLIKPHGSVNWGHCADIGQNPVNFGRRDELALHVIDSFGSMNISEGFELIGEHPPASRNDQAVVPALAIPLVSKSSFECPKSHLQALSDFLPGVTRVLIIGWRATEKSFLQLLGKGLKNNPAVMIVNGTRQQDAEEAENNLRTERILISDCRRLKMGFSDFVLHDAGRAFMTL